MSAVYRSQMNSSLVVTRDMWPVSMVIENRTLSMHTMLIIETIQESGLGKTFRAHLMGPSTLKEKKVEELDRKDPKTYCSCWSTVGKVELIEIRGKLDLTRFRPTFKTWLIEREKVEQMLRQIRDEQEHPEKVDRPFHILGEKSIFSRERVEFDITDQKLLEMRDRQPRKFKKLCDLYELQKSQQSTPIGGDDDVPQMPKEYPFMRAFFGLAGVGPRLIEDNILVGAAVSLATLPVTLLLTVPVLAIDLPRLYYHDRELTTHRDALALFRNHVRKIKVVSQNCFNWTRYHLGSVGVEVGESPSERLFCIPPLYLST